MNVYKNLSIFPFFLFLFLKRLFLAQQQNQSINTQNQPKFDISAALAQINSMNHNNLSNDKNDEEEEIQVENSFENEQKSE